MLSTFPLRNSSAIGLMHVVTLLGIHSNYLRNDLFQALGLDRVDNVRNTLPAADVDFTSLARFRHSILKVDLSDFVKRF